ncbi:MAG: GTP-binding protein, partial [Nocardioidaceae bacterium]
PIDRFELEVPADTMAAALAGMVESGATVHGTSVQDGVCRLAGVIPAGRVHAFEILLPGLSHGEGIFLSSFEGYRPAPAAVRKIHA